MSASNVELLAQAFAGSGKDNPANMRDALHPDCELVVPDSIPYGGTCRGADAIIGWAIIGWFTRELWRCFDELTSTPEGFIDGGDQIVVPVHAQARAKNGKTMHVHNAWIYEFSDGKLTRGRVSVDTAVLRDTVEGITPAGAGSRLDDPRRAGRQMIRGAPLRSRNARAARGSSLSLVTHGRVAQ